MGLAEPRLSPPEPTDAEYARLLRNDLREEIDEAISLIDSRLGELDNMESDEFDEDLINLAKLRGKMRQ